MNELLGTYKQWDNGHPEDAYVPGENKQRVDLTEFYEETNQEHATTMVTGSEALNLGVMSRRFAQYLKVPGAANFDPFASQRNAVAGQEGFFGTLMDGFKEFIENIIKYIRMAFDWVYDTIRGILGFRKSSRINKAVNGSLDDMKQEFSTTLTGLGFPADHYNVENFLGDLPPNVGRTGQLQLLKSKFETDEEAMQGLMEALPLIQKCIAKLTRASDKVTVAAKTLKRVITEEHKRFMFRMKDTAGAVNTSDSPEGNRIMKACMDVKASLDISDISKDVHDLYATLYKIEFNNDELTAGFAKARKHIQDTLETATVEVGKNNVTTVMTMIQGLNRRYLELADKEIDLGKIDFKALGNIVNKDDAAKISDIARKLVTVSKGQAFQSNLQAVYQEATVDLRNFGQFCFSVSQALLVVERQIENLNSWYNRAHQYYYHGLLNDLEAVAKINLEARAAGANPEADARGVPTTKFVFIKDADAKTLGEKIASGAKFSIDADLGGAKTAFSNFAKQTGWGG